MKKKVIGMILCLAMVGTMLAGCGNNDTPTTEAVTEADAGDEAGNDTVETDAPADQGEEDPGDEVNATGDLNVGVFYYAYSDTYIASVRTALDAELDALGVTYQDYDGDNNQTTQNEQIDTALSQGCNLLVVNLVTSGSVDASQQLIDKASAAGVPIVFFNRALGDDGEDKAVLESYDNVAFVGTDAPEAGHMQGQMIGEYIVDNYDEVDLNGDGVISYALFKGDEANVEAIYRSQFGVEDADAVLEAAGKPAMEYFDSANDNKYQVDMEGSWSAAAANEYMVTNLTQYNSDNNNMIEVIICNNDGMAEGVISALNDNGFNLGTDDSTTIPVFGVDATDAAKELIADGKMTGTIKQDAEGMAACIADLTSNIQGGSDLLNGTDSYNKDPEVSNKIYIPYAVYAGE